MACSRGCCDSQREHYLSIAVSAKATPSRDRSREVLKIDRKEDGWDADMPAYKRLRAQGFQPPQIDGCSELERKAETKHEVELGHLFPKERIGKIKEDLHKAKDLGLLSDKADKPPVKAAE